MILRFLFHDLVPVFFLKDHMLSTIKYYLKSTFVIRVRLVEKF